MSVIAIPSLEDQYDLQPVSASTERRAISFLHILRGGERDAGTTTVPNGFIGETKSVCTRVKLDPIDDGALVVVPCLNEAGNIAAIVDGILQEKVAGDILIVVADGGSTDGTRAIVSRMAATVPNVRLIDNLRQTQSAGVNLAVKRFGEGRRWLVRMDAHSDYPGDYVSRLISEARRTQATSIVVAMSSRGKCCFQNAAAIAQNTFLGAGGSAHRMGRREGFVDHGHHALCEMSTFRALKGYDELQTHNEDAEFDARLAQTGGRIWLTRATSLVYYPRSSAPELYSQYRNYGRGRAATLLRHRTRPKLRQLLPAAILPSALGLLLVPFDPAWGLPVLLWLNFCLVYGVCLGVKTRNSCAFAAGAAAIIMHFGWSVGFWTGLLQPTAVWTLQWRPKFQ